MDICIQHPCFEFATEQESWGKKKTGDHWCERLETGPGMSSANIPYEHTVHTVHPVWTQCTPDTGWGLPSVTSEYFSSEYFRTRRFYNYIIIKETRKLSLVPELLHWTSSVHSEHIVCTQSALCAQCARCAARNFCFTGQSKNYNCCTRHKETK